MPTAVLDSAPMIVRDDDFGLDFGSFGTGRDIPITFRFRRDPDAMARLALSNRSVMYSAPMEAGFDPLRTSLAFFQASRCSEIDNAIALVRSGSGIFIADQDRD